MLPCRPVRFSFFSADLALSILPFRLLVFIVFMILPNFFNTLFLRLAFNPSLGAEVAMDERCSLELELELRDPTSVAESMVDARPLRERDWPEVLLVVLASRWWRAVDEWDDGDGMATGAVVLVVWVVVVVVMILLFATRVSTAKELRWLLLCCWGCGGSGGVASDRREGTENSLWTGETGVRGTVVVVLGMISSSGSAVMAVAMTAASATAGVDGAVETFKDSTLEWIEELVSLGRMIFANRFRRSRRGDVAVGDEGDNEDEELDVEVAGEAEGERLGLLSFLENDFEERVVAGETGSEADTG